MLIEFEGLLTTFVRSVYEYGDRERVNITLRNGYTIELRKGKGYVWECDGRGS